MSKLVSLFFISIMVVGTFSSAMAETRLRLSTTTGTENSGLLSGTAPAI